MPGSCVDITQSSNTTNFASLAAYQSQLVLWL
jgi:hypothetical protein